MGDRSSPSPARTSLEKGLDLLFVIADRGRDGMSLSAAARKADMHAATAHRLLGALTARNFVSFDPYSKRYHLGVMPYELVDRAGQDLAFVDFRRRMRCSLKSVQQGAGGIVCLSVPSAGEALCIDVIAGETDITVNTLEIGARRPLGAGGASLALLASLPDTEREAIIERESERYLKYGDLTAEIVRAAAERLATDGYVVNEAVIIPDIAAIAIPLFQDGAAVAAMSVTNVSSRLTASERPRIVSTMREVARRAGFATTEDNACIR